MVDLIKKVGFVGRVHSSPQEVGVKIQLMQLKLTFWENQEILILVKMLGMFNQ